MIYNVQNSSPDIDVAGKLFSYGVNGNVVIPLTHHKNSGYTELKVLGVGRSIILLFTAFLVGVLMG